MHSTHEVHTKSRLEEKANEMFRMVREYSVDTGCEAGMGGKEVCGNGQQRRFSKRLSAELPFTCLM